MVLMQFLSSLMKTFNESIRMKCEGKRKHTMRTKPEEWKYISSRKRRRPSSVHLEHVIDVESLEDPGTSGPEDDDDDYEPDMGVEYDTSSELSEYTVVGFDEAAGVSTLAAKSTASRQTPPPSTGRTPSPDVEPMLKDHHVWHDDDHARSRFPAPPTAPRSMLANHGKRTFPTFPVALFPPRPPRISFALHSKSAQQPTRVPAASPMMPLPSKVEHTRHQMLGGHSNHLAAPPPMNMAAGMTGFSGFPMYDQQSCPSRADYASAGMRPSQTVPQAHGRHAEAAPAGGLRKTSKTGSSSNHYFDYGNIDRFLPKYHAALPRDWRRGHANDHLVYQGDQVGPTMLEPVAVQDADGSEQNPVAPLDEMVAAELRTVSSQTSSPDVLTAGLGVKSAAPASEAQMPTISQPAEQSGESGETSKVRNTSPSSMAPIGPPSKKRKIELSSRSCNACRIRKVKCSRTFPCGQCKRKGRPELCVYPVPKVHFTPSPAPSAAAPLLSDVTEEIVVSSGHTAGLGTGPGAEVINVRRSLPNISPVIQDEERLDGDGPESENLQEDDESAAGVEGLSQNRESPSNEPEHPSQSPERTFDGEPVKQEPHTIKRELLSPEIEHSADILADEGSHDNPINLDISDSDEDDNLPPTNKSCVEVDAGDGVAFCTSFKICKSVEDFFTFVSSLIPPDIGAIHSGDMICSVMVRFANPTKLDTSKMRVYRQRGGPTIVRLNEQLNARMEGSEAGLKFVVEWQRGGNA